MWRLLIASFLMVVASISSAADFYYGVGVHFPAYPGRTPAGMHLLSRAGLHSYRDDLYWHLLEKRAGTYTYSDYYEYPVATAKIQGIAPLLMLGRMSGAYAWPDGCSARPVTELKRAAFAKYVAEVVWNYRGQVFLFELWNE